MEFLGSSEVLQDEEGREESVLAWVRMVWVADGAMLRHKKLDFECGLGQSAAASNVCLGSFCCDAAAYLIQQLTVSLEASGGTGSVRQRVLGQRDQVGQPSGRSF